MAEVTFGKVYTDRGLDNEKRCPVYVAGEHIGDLFNCGGGWEASCGVEERFPSLYGMNDDLRSWKQELRRTE